MRTVSARSILFYRIVSSRDRSLPENSRLPQLARTLAVAVFVTRVVRPSAPKTATIQCQPRFTGCKSDVSPWKNGVEYDQSIKTFRKNRIPHERKRSASGFIFIFMKILIVDDHPVLRDGVATLLRQDNGGMVDIQASNADDAMRLLELHTDLDVIVLDLKMSGMDGFAAIAGITQLRPELPIVVLSSSEDPHDVRAAFTHGALGYIPKSATAHTLLSAIKMVMNGERYVPPLLLDLQSTHRDPPPAHEPDSPRLTLRQLDVLRLIAEGVPNKLIADRLGLSEKTVKAHITAIFKALHVRNRTQAAAAGQRLGLL
ncbi:response regulator transcription factor [Burkholderia sp. Bp8992]|uniref:response regulator n=2 Tax=unclassified Burkholderia TaxID=2613784 RepID=UPI0021AB6DEE|nr:response regulator transcription factor [Burkholderia sp. Bp8992]